MQLHMRKTKKKNGNILCLFASLTIAGLTEEEMKKMTLGLAHGLSRYKLQFSVEKLDVMIVQAISLLDDLDKEINNYMMKLREWYGWHFPELTKIISDNLIYAKVVKLVGTPLHFFDKKKKNSDSDCLRRPVFNAKEEGQKIIILMPRSTMAGTVCIAIIQ